MASHDVSTPFGIPSGCLPCSRRVAVLLPVSSQTRIPKGHRQMKVSWSKTARRGAVLGAATSLAALGLAGTAFAQSSGGTPCAVQNQNDPNNTNPTQGDGVPGGACAVSGTITIPSQLSLYTDVTAFNLTTSVGSLTTTPPADAISGAGHFEVASNVQTGYYIDEAGPSGGFTGTGAVLPDTDIATGILQSGGGSLSTTCPATTWDTLTDPSQSAVTGEGRQVLTTSAASGGHLQCATGGYTPVNGMDDTFNFPGFYLIDFNGSAAGTYTGSVEFALWGT